MTVLQDSNLLKATQEVSDGTGIQTQVFLNPQTPSVKSRAPLSHTATSHISYSTHEMGLSELRGEVRAK